ncbi:MAG: arylamine N-acetyltransferase [Pyrinomonadaceae bacterium]|nr:arylamine N-acetyltransferase [Pyrinomonadaceae bacterium]
MIKEKYLRRIGIEDSDLAINSESLKLLQRRHLLNVAFENLDIHWKRPIILDAKKFYEKIVGGKRGGFCYELNGLFYELLDEIGFQSKIISARVSTEDGEFGAEYDHLAILTLIDGNEYLVDVGFGSFTAEPLRFVSDVEQKDENGVFLIRKFDDEYFEVAKKDGEKWQSEYIFKNLERDLLEFAEMCNFHQTSPESHFTRGKVCSLMTSDGRKTLTDGKFIKTKNSKKSEIDIDSDEKFNEILVLEFNIERSF